MYSTDLTSGFLFLFIKSNFTKKIHLSNRYCKKNHMNITIDLINSIRENVRQGQKKQAEVMQTRRDFVTLPIPDVDKGLTEAPNLICRIIDIEYQFSLYELACEVGVFSDLFSRNAFDLVQNCHIEIEIRTDKPIKSVRQAVNELSIGGGQGMVKCNCTSQCLTNRCGCLKNGKKNKIIWNQVINI
ncbi:KRAB-A domain-containing 2-like [Brachionus plicatilis]|uniref:KRAB-A domain-containing 2-like n=1 Tax=Brachionus plicatilis TaxID=10195 RepID=A0A3M7T230_BRAPC|nr:KRAB-A domain-containing 2-like [Brachionus plicatilis]